MYLGSFIFLDSILQYLLFVFGNKVPRKKAHFNA